LEATKFLAGTENEENLMECQKASFLDRLTLWKIECNQTKHVKKTRHAPTVSPIGYCSIAAAVKPHPSIAKLNTTKYFSFNCHNFSQIKKHIVVICRPKLIN